MRGGGCRDQEECQRGITPKNNHQRARWRGVEEGM